MRYFVHLSYNGESFCGWQTQPNAPSVQACLEEAFSRLLRSSVALTGAGRTDTGVHASCFYAHFDWPSVLSDDDCHRLCQKLNAYLRHPIVIYRIYPVADDLHARFSARSRTYQYFISLAKDPFRYPYSYELHGSIDISRMNEACQLLLDYEDFSCFSKSRTQTHTNLCRIDKALWHRQGDEVVFTVQANRFLRNMVRAMVGTLLEVGQGKISLDDFRRIIESKDRCEAGLSVPAKGLFLVDIQY